MVSEPLLKHVPWVQAEATQDEEGVAQSIEDETAVELYQPPPEGISRDRCDQTE
jgi:hypothetical protein